MEKSFKKNVFILGSLCLLLILLSLLLSFLPKRKVLLHRATGSGVVKVTLDPASGSLNVGSSLTVTVKLTATQAVVLHAAGVNIQFDTDVFTVSTVPSCGSTFPSPAEAKAEGNKIYLSCFKLPAQGTVNLNTNDSVSLGSFQLQVKSGAASGNSSLSFTRTLIPDVNLNDVSDQGTGATYTITGGGTGPTPTVSPNTPVLNFKIKFQGISEKRGDQKVVVRVEGEDEEEEISETFANVLVTANNDGVYSGTVALAGVPAGGGYTIYIKGPRHLSRKFCANNQGNRCTGVGNITLVAGNNTFDFSKLILEGGDLPNPNDNNRQDGVVNSVDWSLINNRLNSSTEADLAVADINLDGVVNSTDRILLRNTLETKYEEEN